MERITVNVCGGSSSHRELWIVCTGCAFVTRSVVDGIGEAIGRGWSDLSFATGRVTTLELVDGMGAETFDLACWSAVETLPAL